MSISVHQNSINLSNKNYYENDIHSESTDDEFRDNSNSSSPYRYSLCNNSIQPSEQFQEPLLNQSQSSPTQQNTLLEKQQHLVYIQTSHNPVEVKYKTQMCENWIKKNFCNYGKKCKFAHGIEELKDLLPIGSNQYYKTKLCKQYHTKGFCTYGFRCHFLHENRNLNQMLTQTFYAKYLITYQIQCNKEIQQEQPKPESNLTQELSQFQEQIHVQMKPNKPRLPIFQQISQQQQYQTNSQSFDN